MKEIRLGVARKFGGAGGDDRRFVVKNSLGLLVGFDVGKPVVAASCGELG